ncbi:hypothetical protein MTO96_039278 [Rhipicephalus appendiculatus]
MSPSQAGYQQVRRHARSNLLQLVQAFVCTHITYVVPYLRLKRADLDRHDASLRKAYKTALGLPMSTSTSKLMALEESNSVNELIEAILTSQYQRLSFTYGGRAVLHQIGLIPARAATTYQDIPTAQRLSLRISAIPKHMHPEHHLDRRADRARQQKKRFVSRSDATYTDALPPTPRLEHEMQSQSLHRWNSCLRGCH